MNCPIDLEPKPRRRVGSAARAAWPVRFGARIPAIVPPIPTIFDEVVENRRSANALAPTSLRELVNCVAYATQNYAAWSKDGIPRFARPTMAAGALHGIDLVLISPGARPQLVAYSPSSSRVMLLRVGAAAPIVRLNERIREMKPLARAYSLVLLANPSIYDAAYENSLSLIWRDAGALLQALHMCAAAYRLAFCALGIHGNEVVEALRPAGDHTVFAVGVAVVGRRP